MDKKSKEVVEKTKGVEAEAEMVTEDSLPAKSKVLRARSIRKRLETERNMSAATATSASDTSSVTSSSSSASSSPPSSSSAPAKRRAPRRRHHAAMSRYRRKTANAKERDRMRHVNDAFERLKGALPAR